MWRWCVPWEADSRPRASALKFDPPLLNPSTLEENSMSESMKVSDTPAAASTPIAADARSGKKRILLFSLLALAVAAAGGGYYTYWERVGSRYVSTDNAYTAAEVAVVTSEIDGPVAAVNVVDSQQVKSGDVLIVIDDTDTKLALRQAEAELARAQS